jgi:hypothetical protein
MNEPTQVKKRALDVTPYEHSVWCTVAGGKPFANTIVHRRWAGDGIRVVFMLDSHNFMFADPDEEIDVIENEQPFYSVEFQRECLRSDAERMKRTAVTGEGK